MRSNRRYAFPLGAEQQWASKACHEMVAPNTLFASRIVIGRAFHAPPCSPAAVAELGSLDSGDVDGDQFIDPPKEHKP